MVSHNPKAILFVSHASQPGGAETVLIDIITACATRYDTYLFTPRGHYPALLQHAALKKLYTVWFANGAVDISWSLVNWLLLPFGVIKNFLRLISIIKRDDIDLVITNTSTIFYGALAARWCRRKHILIIHEHIPYSAIRRLWFAINERYSQTIIFLNKTIQQYYHQSKKTIVIPLGIALKKIQQLQQIKKIPSPVQRVSLVGRIYPIKGTDRFVDLAVAVLAARPDLPVQFTMYGAIGDRSFFQRLQAKISAVHAQTKIQFKPHQPIEQILADTDIIVVASRSETGPLIIPEAMAAGIPVVTFAVGNASEIVVDQVTGYVVASGNIAQLQVALLKLLTQPKHIIQFGSAAQRLVTDQHVSRFTTEMLALINATFNGGKFKTSR